MSQDLKNTVHELEEITDISEPVIILTDDDLVPDIPEEEKVSGELEEITGLQDITTSPIIVEDENPPLEIQQSSNDDIISITANVDAIRTVKAVKKTVVPDKIYKEKEQRLFEDIPEPLESPQLHDDKSHIKDSYIDTTVDEENREIKGKIYYDKNIDALIIEDFSEDEERAQTEQEVTKVYKEDTFEVERPLQKSEFTEEDISIKEEYSPHKPEADVITIEIPPEVRSKIEEKEIEDFQFINLDEAEQIASEDILILSEDDLIEELEEYDLIPVETAIEEKKSKEKKKEKVTVDAKVSTKSQTEKKAPEIVQPLELDFTENIEPKLDEEKKKAKPEKSEEYSIKPKEDAIELKQEAIPIVEEIIEEIPEKNVKVDVEPESKLEPKDHKEEIEFIALEEEKESEFTPVAIKTSHGISDTEQLMKDYARFKTETIPDGFVTATNQKILIIDDVGVDSNQQLITEENPIDDIDKLVSGMIEITEGEARILREASAKEEDEYIAPILTGTLPTFQDRMVEFEEEYKFKDDDIVFIDNAVLVDEYDKYLKVIDEYYETKVVKKSSSTVELFGLTKDEFAFFYDILFEKEYETVKASKAFKDVAVGRDQPEKDAKLVKQFKYIQAKPQSLTENEKKSIEEDIESPVAVVIEENIDDIVARLKKIKPNIDVKKLLGQIPQQHQKMDEDSSGTYAVAEEKLQEQEEIANITDQVIILESKEDVNRFVDTLPVEKQENIRKLLKYLDSLFDKLPEDVIKNFASSEYFDLYVKVLNELGV